jgi:hypothetical protein
VGLIGKLIGWAIKATLVFVLLVVVLVVVTVKQVSKRLSKPAVPAVVPVTRAMAGGRQELIPPPIETTVAVSQPAIASSPAEVESLPAPAASSLLGAQSETNDDVVDGLTQDKRRQIFYALHLSGFEAAALAQARFPASARPDTVAQAKKFLAQRGQFHQLKVKEGRVALVRQFKVDGDTLDRIDYEGYAKNWPLPKIEGSENLEPLPLPEEHVSSGYGSGTHVGPRGGVYHYSKSGRKVYESRK